MSSATVPLLDDTVPFGDEELDSSGGAKRLSHPYVTFFHVFFRGAAVATYLFWGLFSDSFIKCFLMMVFLLSADFYLVKNLSGRLLVGMRWWNYVDDDGRSHWVFESKKGDANYEARINPHEARLFWMALVVCPVIWSLLLLVALVGFKFEWMLLVLIALSLNGANLYGYIKCNFGAGANLSTTTTDFVKSQVLKNAVSLMTQSSTPAASAAPKPKIVA
uniref:Golgi apparatus membrane protein TVP23 homolog n=1 Tax=Culex pipiens TaxID=7175 RepID=A0A8D8K2W2_CULPI